jgi:hypothetical protein
MNKKPFMDLLRTLFNRVEKTETALAEKLVEAGANPTLVSFVYELYNTATDKDGKPRYRYLTQRVDKKTANALKTRRDELAEKLSGEEYAEVLTAFPLTVTKFDQLNRINATKAYYALEELASAMREAEIMQAHFDEWADTVFALTEAYFKVHGRSFKRAVTDWYAWRNSMYIQRLKVGQEAAEKLAQGIIRQQAVEITAEEIETYLDRRERAIDSRIYFTEDTEITEAVAVEIMKPYVTAFYTVTVKDGRTCAECLAIEREQATDPVPIDAYEPGVTAPPFHPHCRCYIEFIWKE